jgi:hypothetical protein
MGTVLEAIPRLGRTSAHVRTRVKSGSAGPWFKGRFRRKTREGEGDESLDRPTLTLDEDLDRSVAD